MLALSSCKECKLESFRASSYRGKVMGDVVKIKRAPVLTMWAAAVAERLSFDWEKALTLGRAVASLDAYSKGESLGLSPHPERRKEIPSQTRKG